MVGNLRKADYKRGDFLLLGFRVWGSRRIRSYPPLDGLWRFRLESILKKLSTVPAEVKDAVQKPESSNISQTIIDFTIADLASFS